MTLFALALVLVSALLHASWNLLAKRVGSGGAPFVWLYGACAALLYAPLALAAVVLLRPHVGPVEFAFLVGTAMLHTGYFLLLQRGYRTGDLSLVYPLARGTGPVLATAAAVAFFEERPSLLALSGLVLVAAGVFLLAGGGVRGSGGARAVAYGVATGAFIAAYTLWDKHAADALMLPPVLYLRASTAGQALLLAPVAARRWEEVRAVWCAHRKEVVGVALLSPLAYLLVLAALVFTAVSYVAPVREVGILFGVLIGSQLLVEGHLLRRLTASGTVVLGIAALALG